MCLIQRIIESIQNAPLHGITHKMTEQNSGKMFNTSSTCGQVMLVNFSWVAKHLSSRWIIWFFHILILFFQVDTKNKKRGGGKCWNILYTYHKYWNIIHNKRRQTLTRNLFLLCGPKCRLINIGSLCTEKCWKLKYSLTTGCKIHLSIWMIHKKRR